MARRLIGTAASLGVTAWEQLRARSWAELLPLVVLAVAAAAMAVFIHIAEEVLEGDTHKIDSAILLALRAPGDTAEPIGPWWVDIAARDITSLGSTTALALITLAVAGYLLIGRKRAGALLLLACVGGGALLSSALKHAFARPRPDLVAHLVDVHTLSFPSGHAMLSAATYLTLGAMLARLAPGAHLKAYLLGVGIALTLLIGMSRVYLGVHWPTDVLAGWCAGAAWAMGCWLAAWWLQRRGRVENALE
ncbi:MAG: phosphatase PAP2 family protein [Hyphomicrobiales bacterium]